MSSSIWQNQRWVRIFPLKVTGNPTWTGLKIRECISSIYITEKTELQVRLDLTSSRTSFIPFHITSLPSKVSGPSLGLKWVPIGSFIVFCFSRKETCQVLLSSPHTNHGRSGSQRGERHFCLCRSPGKFLHRFYWFWMGFCHHESNHDSQRDGVGSYGVR